MAKSGIQTYIDEFLAAKYGEDVRAAIVAIAQQLYDDVMSPTLNREGFRAVIQQLIEEGTIDNDFVEAIDARYDEITERSTNLFDKFAAVIGLLSKNTGEVISASTGYKTSDWIEITPGSTYHLAGQIRVITYKLDKSFSRYLYDYDTFTALSSESGDDYDECYVRITFSLENLDIGKLNEGENCDYEPYRTAVDYNLRKDVYRKAEVDALIAGFDVSLTAEQKAALIALLD